MKIRRPLVLLCYLATTTPVAFSNNSDKCYYTSTAVCKPIGTVLSQTPVPCRTGSLTATLYDQMITEQPSYRYIAVEGTDGLDGRAGKRPRSFENYVPFTRISVDPATCNIMIRKGAGIVRIVCSGEEADPQAWRCQYALTIPSKTSDQALAALTQ